MKKVVAGIDIGGTFTKLGIVDRSGRMYADNSFELRGIGIGAPNGNYHNGTIEYAPNLNWKGVIPLAGMLKKTFHLPVVLTNDANAAAIGEMMYGAARDMEDFIVITLGTGLGSGIVVDGRAAWKPTYLPPELKEQSMSYFLKEMKKVC